MYARFVDGEIEFKEFKSDAEAKEAGYKPITDEKPIYDPITEKTEPYEYREEGDTIFRVHRVVPQDLDVVKARRIYESKEILAKFLDEHPMPSTCKYEEGRLYTITSEKQQQLTSKLLVATVYSQLGMEYNLTWNSTGDECEPYTLEQLTQLSMEIDAVVTALVKHQQELETQMNEETTIEGVLSIKIEYTVPY